MSLDTRTETMRDAAFRKSCEAGKPVFDSMPRKSSPKGAAAKSGLNSPADAKAPSGKGTRKIEKPKVGVAPLASVMKDVDRIAARYATAGKSCVMRGRAGIACDQTIDPAHVLKRTNRHVRHSPINILPVCRAHHDHYEPRVQEWRESVDAVTEPTRVASLIVLLAHNRAVYGTDLRACYEMYRDLYEGKCLPGEEGGSDVSGEGGA